MTHALPVAQLPPLYVAPVDAARAQCYATALELRVMEPERWRDHACKAGAEAFWLCFQKDRLELLRGAERRGQFVTASDVRRRAVSTTALARACGFRKRRNAHERAQKHVLDATAGWGVDGYSLALLGARVTLMERHPAVWALCHDLGQRLASTLKGPAPALHQLDFEDWLWDRSHSAVEAVDVLHLDPMFPPRSKRAAPGKRLQYLAALLATATAVAPSEPSAAQLEAWISRARERVQDRIVVKRRRHDPPGRLHADWQIEGRSVRYDVFSAR